MPSDALTATQFLAELRDAYRHPGGPPETLGQSAARYIGGNAEAGSELASNPGARTAERERQKRALVEWARLNGRLIERLPRSFSWNSPDNVGGAEHDVWPDKPSRRWVKVTKPSFGMSPSATGDILSPLSPSTVAQYLDRIENLDKFFGLPTKAHGVLLDARGNPSLVISQPHVAIDRPLAPLDVRKHVQDDGFLPIDGDDSPSFYRPSDNTLVTDAHGGNVGEIAGKLTSWDAALTHPVGKLRDVAQREYDREAARRAARGKAMDFLERARLGR